MDDLNQDGNDEIVLIQLHSSDQDSNRADYYVAQGGMMTMHNSVFLSKKLSSIDGSPVPPAQPAHRPVRHRFRSGAQR